MNQSRTSVCGWVCVLGVLVACGDSGSSSVPIDQVPPDKKRVDLSSGETQGVCDWVTSLAKQKLAGAMCNGSPIMLNGCLGRVVTHWSGLLWGLLYGVFGRRESFADAHGVRPSRGRLHRSPRGARSGRLGMTDATGPRRRQNMGPFTSALVACASMATFIVVFGVLPGLRNGGHGRWP
jgi:hypothetical protein